MFPLPGWNYSGDPTTSPKDEVRFLTGDVNQNDPQLLDAEINYTLKLVYGTSPPPPSGNYVPAIYCLQAIAAKYARAADKSVGDLHISYGQRQKQYLEMIVMLRQRASLAAVPFYVGGLSIGDKLTAYLNPDLLTTAVRIDGMSNADTNSDTEFPISNQTTLP